MTLPCTAPDPTCGRNHVNKRNLWLNLRSVVEND